MAILAIKLKLLKHNIMNNVRINHTYDPFTADPIYTQMLLMLDQWEISYHTTTAVDHIYPKQIIKGANCSNNIAGIGKAT